MVRGLGLSCLRGLLASPTFLPEAFLGAYKDCASAFSETEY